MMHKSSSNNVTFAAQCNLRDIVDGPDTNTTVQRLHQAGITTIVIDAEYAINAADADALIDALTMVADTAATYLMSVAVMIPVGFIEGAPSDDTAIACDSHGNPLQVGHYYVGSPTSPWLVRTATAQWDRLCRALASTDNITAIIGDGPWNYGITQTYDDTQVDAWRSWLVTTYANGNGFRHRWQVGPVATADAVTHCLPPRGNTINPLQWEDWCRFTSTSWLSLFRQLKDTVHHVLPDTAVTVTGVGLDCDLDPWQWWCECDVVVDSSPIGTSTPHTDATHHPHVTLPDSTRAALYADIARSCADTPWIWAPATANITATPMSMRSYEVSPPRPGRTTMGAVAKIARGARSIALPDWYTLLLATPSRPRDDIYINELSALSNAMPHMQPCATDAARVAIIVDRGALWREQVAPPTGMPTHHDSVLRWYHTFYEAAIPVDVIPRDMATDSYDIIVAPHVTSMDSTLANRLHDVANRGGQVIVTAPAGRFVADALSTDSFGLDFHEVVTSPVPDVTDPGVTHPLVDTMCVQEHPDMATTDHPVLTTVMTEPNSPLALATKRLLNTDILPDFTASGIVERVSIVDSDDEDQATILAQFAGDGLAQDMAYWPAVTRRHCGDSKGAWWYVATNPGPVLRAAIIKLATTYAGRFTKMVSMPRGVECVTQGNTTAYINHCDAAREVAGAMGYDVISGHHCAGHMVLPPRSAAVVVPRK